MLCCASIVIVTVGSDMNVRSVSGDTPMMSAVYEENYNSVLTLLELGANVNAVNAQNQWGALHIAARLGNINLIGLLLDHGAHMELSAGTKTKRVE